MKRTSLLVPVILGISSTSQAFLWWSAETASKVPELIPAQLSQIPAPVVKSAVAQAAEQASDVMNQNLTFNLNYSPTQVKIPLMLPPQFLHNIIDKIPVDTAKQWSHRATGFITQRKYLLLAFSCSLGYIWLCHLCVKANAFIARVDTWSTWKRIYSFDELSHFDHAELTKELLIDIQRRYINHNNPTDFISPLIMFVREIEAELTILKRIQLLSRWSKRLFLTKILPLNSEVISHIDERLARLAFVNNLFLLWAAQYALEHNKRSTVANAF